MGKSNFERMIELADEVFDVRHDPDQLNINEKVIKKLQQIHPSTMSEYDEGEGPLVWILVIPTTIDLMNKFIKNEINEKQLLDLTTVNSTYDCIYLCSALVLPEYRGKGLAKQVAVKAVEDIKRSQPIRNLFAWAFSKEGDKLAEKISELTGIKLIKKPSHY